MPRRSWLQAASLTLAGAGVVVMGAYFLQLLPPLGVEATPLARPAATAAAEPLPSSAPAAEPPQPSEAAPEMVRIKLQVVPEGAHVFLDGAALEMPADLAMEQSGRTHLLHLRAPGYEPFDTEFSQLDSADLVFEMTPKRARRRSARGHRRHETTTTAHDVETAGSPAVRPRPAAPTTAPGLLPPTEVRQAAGALGTAIDTDNPYAD